MHHSFIPQFFPAKQDVFSRSEGAIVARLQGRAPNKQNPEQNSLHAQTQILIFL